MLQFFTVVLLSGLSLAVNASGFHCENETLITFLQSMQTKSGDLSFYEHAFDQLNRADHHLTASLRSQTHAPSTKLRTTEERLEQRYMKTQQRQDTYLRGLRSFTAIELAYLAKQVVQSQRQLAANLKKQMATQDSFPQPEFMSQFLRLRPYLKLEVQNELIRSYLNKFGERLSNSEILETRIYYMNRRFREEPSLQNAERAELTRSRQTLIVRNTHHRNPENTAQHEILTFNFGVEVTHTTWNVFNTRLLVQLADSRVFLINTNKARIYEVDWRAHPDLKAAVDAHLTSTRWVSLSDKDIVLEVETLDGPAKVQFAEGPHQVSFITQ